VEFYFDLLQVWLCSSSVGGVPSFSLLDRSLFKAIGGFLVEDPPLGHLEACKALRRFVWFVVDNPNITLVSLTFPQEEP
jgi:hypothetical protein